MTPSKGSAVGVVLGVGVCAAVGIRVVLLSVVAPRLLHLLPCCEDICAGLCIPGFSIWFLRGWRRAKVPVGKPVCTAVVRVVVLGRGRTLWGLRFGGRSAIVGPVGGRRRVCVSLGCRRPRPGCIGCVGRGGRMPVLPPLCVILCSLGWVA